MYYINKSNVKKYIKIVANMENNKYKFEQFTSFKGKFSPIISIGRTGGFGFSSGFYNRYKLEDSVALKVFYDKERMAIAFKFSKAKEDDSLKLKPGSSGIYVPARSFFGKYNINPGKYAGRYTPQELDDNDSERMFVIELKEKTKD